MDGLAIPRCGQQGASIVSQVTDHLQLTDLHWWEVRSRFERCIIAFKGMSDESLICLQCRCTHCQLPLYNGDKLQRCNGHIKCWALYNIYNLKKLLLPSGLGTTRALPIKSLSFARVATHCGMTGLSRHHGCLPSGKAGGSSGEGATHSIDRTSLMRAAEQKSALPLRCSHTAKSRSESAAADMHSGPGPSSASSATLLKMRARSPWRASYSNRSDALLVALCTRA